MEKLTLLNYAKEGALTLAQMLYGQAESLRQQGNDHLADATEEVANKMMSDCHALYRELLDERVRAINADLEEGSK